MFLSVVLHPVKQEVKIKKQQKKLQSNTLERSNYFFNYLNAWLIKGCPEDFLKMLSFWMITKEKTSFGGLTLLGTCSMRSGFHSPVGDSGFREF